MTKPSLIKFLEIQCFTEWKSLLTGHSHYRVLFIFFKAVTLATLAPRQLHCCNRLRCKTHHLLFSTETKGSMILGVLRSKWPKGGGRPLYPQLRTFVRNVYLIAITLHNAQLSEKFFHVCLWLSFHWSCIFSHFDNTSDFSQRKQSHYEYQWKMFFSVKDSQSGISWLSFKITRVGREKQVNLGGILARKLMNSFEKAPTVLIVIRRSLHGQPFFFKNGNGGKVILPRF